MTHTLDRILSYFPTARKSGNGYEARCPSHEDHDPSLSIADGENGRVVIHCHKGCQPRDVMAALGLHLSDLFGDPILPPSAYAPTNGHKANGGGQGRGVNGHSRIVATYPYHDANGTILFEVVRHEPKKFRQRRPDGRGGFIWNLDGVGRVLYRLPELLNADPSRPVYLVEGEKDAQRLAAGGLVSTTSPQGADSWGKGDYAPSLRGRDVIILPDNDDNGRSYAHEAAASLLGVARTCRIVQLSDLPAKGDVSDWLDAGRTIDDLETFVATPTAVAPSRFTVHWADEVWENDDTIDWVIDGVFSAGSVNLIYGSYGTKKTYIVMDAALAVATGDDWLKFPVHQGTVLLIDEESGPRRLRRRFKELMKGRRLGKNVPVAWITLSSLNLSKSTDIVALADLIEQIRPRFVVLDALVDLMPGKDENSATETQPILQTLKLIAERNQLAMLIIHHENKIGGYRGSTAIPGVVDVLLKVTSEHQSASIEFKTEKVRDGEPLEFAAMIAFDDVDMTTHFVAVNPNPVSKKLSSSQQYVLRFLRSQPNQRALLGSIMGNADTCSPRTAKNAVYQLAEMGDIRLCSAGDKGAGPAEYVIVDAS